MCKFLISSISLVYLLLIKSTLVLTLMKEAAIGIYVDEKKPFPAVGPANSCLFEYSDLSKYI